MAGYNDAPVILRIREMLADDPGMSRRAAILDIAGPGSLRRIERKMQAEDRDAPFALDSERRRVAAAAHAEAYPARVQRGLSGGIAFAGRQPGADGRSEDVLAGIVNGIPVGVHGNGVLDSLEGGSDIFLLSILMRCTTDFVTAAYGLWCLGLLLHPDEDAWPHPGGPYHRRLSHALRDAWRALGLGAHLDDAQILEEACAVEGDRLRDAGLDEVLARFPEGFARAIAPFVFQGGEHIEFRHPRAAMAEWLADDPRNVRTVLGLGALGRLAQPGGTAGRIDPGLPFAETVFRLLRKDRVVGSDGLTLDDAAWLHRTFAPLRGILLDPGACEALLANRSWIQGLGELGETDRLALARLVSAACEDSLFERGEGLFLALRRLVPATGMPADVLEAIGGGDGAGGTTKRRLADLCMDLDALALSAWMHVALLTQRAIEARWVPGTYPYGPYWHGPATGEMGLAMTGGVTRIADGLLTTGRDAAGMVALVDAWVSAGRPGHVSPPYRTRDGGIGERAFDSVRITDPGIAPGEWPALLAFLTGFGGTPQLGEVLGLGISALAETYVMAGIDDASKDGFEVDVPPAGPGWWRRIASRGAGLLRAGRASA